jgi:pyrimidine operon attenuation protein/uracil phosphoribosyltransferase
MGDRVVILSGEKVRRKIERMVHQLIEHFYGEDEIVVIGIRRKGALLSQRIVDRLNEIQAFKIDYFELSMQKDDPLNHPISIDPNPNDLTDKKVVLIDDVLNSGRTLIYASKHILQFPLKSLTTLCLVDRIHRRFPIKADIVGLSLSTTLQEHILVDLQADEETIYLE